MTGRDLPVPVERLATDGTSLPAYATDLAGLRTHARRIRAALPPEVEILYAAKANADADVLRVLDPILDGVEVASGGELAHVRAVLPHARTAFGGPGKSSEELRAGLRAGVQRFHVESPHELRLLAAATAAVGRDAEVLLRINPPTPVPVGALAMGGAPTPFGMDLDALDACLPLLAEAPRLRLRGVHAHLVSGPDAHALLGLASGILGWAHGWAHEHDLPLAEANLGGGMGVDYADPGAVFDWDTYGRGLAALAREHAGVRLRIEPGRALSAYCGYYLTRVVDIRRSYGHAFAVLDGGTHHLRTPAAKGHDQPFQVLGVDTWPPGTPRPAAHDEAVTLVGRLCTPRDVLAHSIPLARLRAGDVVVFEMAGAYAWNISHHDFLLHPHPGFHGIDQS